MDDELIEQRFDLVGDQIEHLCQRVEALEEAREDRAEAKESRDSRRMNGWMLGLFVVEVVIGLVEIWMMSHA